MADEALKLKIRDVLKRGFFSDPDDLVDVSHGDGDCIHVVVVSRKFDGRRMRERSNLLWAQFWRGLTRDGWERISLSVARSPEEIKAS
jgi:stress-induced morphogen